MPRMRRRSGVPGGAMAKGLAAALVMIGAVGWAGPLAAQTTEIQDRSTLRVCADPANLPFSNEAEEGFENKIARLLADDLGLPIQYTWFPQATGFVRNTLQARLCDVVIGISLGFELLQNTNPYYRSAYAMIYRAESGLTLAALDDPALKDLHLGVVAGTPPASIVAKNGLLGQVRPYPLMVDTRFENSGKRMVAEIAAGEIDVGLLWGPMAGYYAKQHTTPLRVVALRSNPNEVRMDFRITMGLRFNEPEWKHTLNDFIARRQDDINAILFDFGVPLLDEKGGPIAPPEKKAALDAVPEPAGYRMEAYRAPVPPTIAGGRTMTTEQVAGLVEAGGAVLVDVMVRPPKPAGLKEGTLWRPRPRRNIPGSTWLVNTGFGALSVETEQYFRGNLTRLTGGDRSRALVFYCLADCWMSWNAAKRAIFYGYTDVRWYPDGTDGWTAAGLPTEDSEPVGTVATQ